MKKFDFQNGKETISVKIEPFGNWFELAPNSIFCIEWDDHEMEAEVLSDDDELRLLLEFDDDTRFFIDGKKVDENGIPC